MHSSVERVRARERLRSVLPLLLFYCFPGLLCSYLALQVHGALFLCDICVEVARRSWDMVGVISSCYRIRGCFLSTKHLTARVQSKNHRDRAGTDFVVHKSEMISQPQKESILNKT